MEPPAAAPRTPRAVVPLALAGALGCTELVGSTDGSVPDRGPPDAPTADVPAPDASCAGRAPARAVAEAAHFGGNMLFSGALVDPRGRTWLYGSWLDCARPGSSSDACVVRLGADGRRDAAFGANGRFCDGEREGAPDASVELVGATLTRDGRFVGVGFAGNLPVTEGYVVRLNDDSTIDPSFGDGGTVHVALRGPDGRPMNTVFTGVTEDADGSLVLTGTDAPPYNSTGIGLLWRLRADGSPDPTFHGGAPVLDTGAATYWDVVPAGDGYAAGGASVTQWHPRVVRYTRAGERVTSFGDGGVASGTVPLVPRALLADRRGGFLVAGPSRQANSLWAITAQRFTAEGRLDAAYGNDGVFLDPTLLVDPGANRRVYALGCDGSLDVLAYRETSLDGARRRHSWWLRVSPEGRADPGFAEGGAALTALSFVPAAMSFDVARSRTQAVTFGGVFGDVQVGLFRPSP